MSYEIEVFQNVILFLFEVNIYIYMFSFEC